MPSLIATSHNNQFLLNCKQTDVNYYQKREYSKC